MEFFEQTKQLLQAKQSAGEMIVTYRPCGECPDVKRRQSQSQRTMQFVWPYWHAGANGDEIRFSVRSVESFFNGHAKCTIIGDRPPWYTGHYIQQQRVSARTQSRSYRDMLSKVWTMATHAEIDADFVWMMDDIYFIKPFTADDVVIPRAELWRASKLNKWQTLKTQSMAALAERGLPTHDYATHLPHHVEKQKLHALFDRYDLHNTTLTWEILYGNTYRETPQSSRPFLSRIGTPMTHDQVQRVTRASSVLNHTAGAWCEGIRSFLQALMPDMASVETDSHANPIIRQSSGRVVKRRPPETHRSFIEAQR